MAAKPGGKNRGKGSENGPKRPDRRALYVILLVFISGWMFYIGVLVGRGTSPVQFDMERLQERIISLKTAAIKGKQEDVKLDPESSEIKRELGFYESLKQDQDTGSEFIEVKKERGPETGLEETAEKTEVSAPDSSIADKPSETRAEQAASGQIETESAEEKSYSIQAASSKDLAEAQKLAAIYRANGFDAYTVSVQVGESGTWHRVRIGPFATFMEANKVLGAVQRERPDALVLEHDPIPDP